MRRRLTGIFWLLLCLSHIRDDLRFSPFYYCIQQYQTTAEFIFGVLSLKCFTCNNKSELRRWKRRLSFINVFVKKKWQIETFQRKMSLKETHLFKHKAKYPAIIMPMDAFKCMIRFRPAWDGFPESFMFFCWHLCILSSPRPASLIRAASHNSLIHLRLGFTACSRSWRGWHCPPAEARRINQGSDVFLLDFAFLLPLFIFTEDRPAQREQPGTGEAIMWILLK